MSAVQLRSGKCARVLEAICLAQETRTQLLSFIMWGLIFAEHDSALFIDIAKSKSS